MPRFDHTPAKAARARQLRRGSTRPELKLWLCLRGAQLSGHSFRRQHPVGPYILDFYCASAKLAVELDGDQHATPEARAYDGAARNSCERKASPSCASPITISKRISTASSEPSLGRATQRDGMSSRTLVQHPGTPPRSVRWDVHGTVAL